jgi:hypothetical protein
MSAKHGDNAYLYLTGKNNLKSIASEPVEWCKPVYKKGKVSIGSYVIRPIEKLKRPLTL